MPKPGFHPMSHENPGADIGVIEEIASAARGDSERKYPVAVEIGTWAGSTSLQLARLGYIVFCVDHWEGNPADRLGTFAKDMGPETVFQTFCHNAGNKLFNRLFPLFGPSSRWAAVWPAHLPIDFLYIDADHRYEYVLQDIQAWSKHVRPGGTIAGHDFNYFSGVNKAVEETGNYTNPFGSTVWYRIKEHGA